MGVFTVGTALATTATITSTWMTTISNDINFMAADGGTAVAKDLFFARQGVAQTLASSTPTALTFGGEDIDAAAGHDTTSNTSRYTCKLTAGTGIYSLSGGVALQNTGGTDTNMRAQFYRNGTAIGSLASVEFPNPAGTMSYFITMPPYLTTLGSGEYVELVVTSSRAGTTDVTGQQSCFGVEWIGYKA